MSEHITQTDPESEAYWKDFLLNGFLPFEQRYRRLFGKLPSDPRCKLCYAPFKGFGSSLVKTFFGKKQSNNNPTMCNVCEDHMVEHLGGAEVEISMLFADVRGSTTLAERMSIAEFHSLIDRFYQVSVRALTDGGAFIDKLIGDEVSGGYAPGIAGPQHARLAIQAAQQILRATGHADPGGPWIPVGVGVHTGVAYVGTVGASGGVVDITFLGDAPNLASRLASNAAAGEILVSEEAWQAAQMDLKPVEERCLQVKGRTQPAQVQVLRLAIPANNQSEVGNSQPET